MARLRSTSPLVPEDGSLRKPPAGRRRTAADNGDAEAPTPPPPPPPSPNRSGGGSPLRWIVLAAVVLLGAGTASAVLHTSADPWPAAHGVAHADVPLDAAMSALRGEVTDVQLDAEQGRVAILVPEQARTAAVDAASADGPIVLDARFPVPYADEMVAALLAAETPFSVIDGTQPTATSEYVRGALPYAALGGLLIAALVFVRRHHRASSFEQSVGGRHQAVLDVPTTRFTDVLGADEAVEDLAEVVAFLTHPERFAAVGATAPKGVLLSGPPGCGKTLLARAVAGEAGAAFFAVSGSEFVEMYVGVGAKRVRNLFDRARASGRAIVFIDEIDAVGRARSSGGASSHEERENTLNQLLVELDGFTGSNVIVIAATNRSDLLDEALKRSGRFDREVAVARPDRAGRAALLRAYLGRRRMDPTLDIDAVADALAPRTAGLVGADMAVLANEAAINAARGGRTSISQDDLDAAVERAQIGKARTSAIVSERMRRIVAWHEAGHTVCALRTPGAPRPTRVSIVPRGDAGGVTWLDPGDDALRTRSEWIAQLVVSFGGRAGEGLILGDDITHGASGDIIAATDLATKMVCEWGMSSLGKTFIRADVVHGPTGEVVRTAVAELCERASTAAEACLQANRELVEAVVAELLERETIDATVIERLNAAFPARAELALLAG